MTKPMPDHVRQAIVASADKWEVNSRVSHIAQANIYFDSCPLCDLFYRDRLGHCFGCPVKRATRLPGCEGSPWMKAARKYINAAHHTELLPEFHVAAKDMEMFLRALVPAVEPPKE